ncbi:MAG TPA: response regulator [Candidatus Limnocylindrales bacterium]|nr:response regulator [Candidatus Limnocylindrales bacterium]
MITAGAFEEQVHVLIAEDSPTQAAKLRHTLECHGYQVTTAVNGREALEIAQASPPTIIISDVVMPEMDGYQLCRAVKDSALLANIPVILVTTLSDPQDVIRGLECRADNFIIKPYDERYLISRIRFVLLNYELRQSDHTGMGLEIYFNGQRHVITADRLQILNLLLSTYEAAVERNRELSRAKEDLRALNQSLAEANEELAAFSYSVSHDLRGPLRAIEGFSSSLAEDYADRLDAPGKDMLARVHNACQRMAQLIEDLLKLSRLGRQQMNREPVDLSQLCQSIADSLQLAEPARKVQFEIAQNLRANADARLARVALENLLGNAWKFTQERPDARIELGRMPDGTFFVRDNGAGFDMAHADKLFRPFQRLHGSEDFPGTGIGLATVHRIIQRHGGRIWAEADVGSGATFYFTL